jgi:F-box protein 39
VLKNGKPLVCNTKTRKKEKKALKIRVKKDTPKIESHWDELPDLLLEEIFSYLTIRQRFEASQVCQTWYDAFYLPKVWSTLVLNDSTLVRRKFNYYMGWQVS